MPIFHSILNLTLLVVPVVLRYFKTSAFWGKKPMRTQQWNWGDRAGQGLRILGFLICANSMFTETRFLPIYGIGTGFLIVVFGGLVSWGSSNTQTSGPFRSTTQSRPNWGAFVGNTLGLFGGLTMLVSLWTMSAHPNIVFFTGAATLTVGALIVVVAQR